MNTVLLVKFLLGTTLYGLIVFLMIKVEYISSQFKAIVPNKRKIIPFQEVQKHQRVRDRSWV